MNPDYIPLDLLSLIPPKMVVFELSMFQKEFDLPDLKTTEEWLTGELEALRRMGWELRWCFMAQDRFWVFLPYEGEKVTANHVPSRWMGELEGIVK